MEGSSPVAPASPAGGSSPVGERPEVAVLAGAPARSGSVRSIVRGSAVPIGSFRHTLGPADAPIVVVEYGDFQCPYCARAAPVLHEFVESSEGQVRLVFRHFPVFDVHPYALTAALAAEAAGAHGRFWEMHDLLFAHQERLADKFLRYYGGQVGLDGDDVVGDAAQPFGDAVEADYARGIEQGVRGTPSLFINGAPYRGRTEVAPLRKAASLSLRRQRRAPWSRR